MEPIYQEGTITVYQADCIDYMQTLPDNAFDIAIVDPPYFSGPERRTYYGKKQSKTGVTRTHYDKLQNWQVPCEAYFAELRRVSRHQIIWGCNYYSTALPVGRIVWDKVNDGTTYSDLEMASCSLHIGSRLFRYMWNGMMQGKSISEGHIQQADKRKNQRRIHQTEKPIALYEWLLKTYVKPGQKVLDTHGGSLSHAIAAHRLGIDLTAVEIDPVALRRALSRLREFQNITCLPFTYVDA